jgi:hypothetical protein
MWVGQLGSGVGIFNGLFQVTAVTLGIDLFIYIVSALVLLIVHKCYQLNNEERAAASTLAGSSNVFLVVQSIGWLPPTGATLPPLRGTFKILEKYLLNIQQLLFIC